MTINALAASQAKSPLEKFSYQPDKLGPKDVLVQVSHCGICHSDIHLIDNDWGISSYPLVPGHEIVGTVAQKGDQVEHLQIGQRVGIGWQRGSCLSCEYCVRGDENLCAKSLATCVGHFGGFADSVVADARFAFPIPDKISSENAAPLLCGGITVYAPLRFYNVQPHHKVGVIGIGGLGHLAIQFARAFGCEVTAFTTSKDKAAELKKWGASKVVASNDAAALAGAASSQDFILSTVFADLDWNAYVGALRPDGKLCFVGVPSGPLTLPVFPLIGGRKSVCGSVIGSRHTISEMLEFAARHGIAAQTEAMPLSQANEAIARVRKNQVRYRMVLTTGK